MLQGAIKNLEETKHAGTKQLVEKSILLHMMNIVKENIGWYVMNGVVSPTAAKNLDLEHDQCVKDYVPFMNTAIEGLGVFSHEHLIGPIARDYVAYNS